MSNKDDHARRRRLLSPAFAKNVVERHEDFIAHKIQNLVDKLKAKQGEIIDVLAMWRLFTADIVVLASLGTDLKMTESAEIHPFVSDVDSALSMSIFRSLTGSTLYNVGQWMATRLLKRSNETRRAFEARDRAINEVSLCALEGWLLLLTDVCATSVWSAAREPVRCHCRARCPIKGNHIAFDQRHECQGETAFH